MGKVEQGSSGSGNSFQSDWQKCQRYFFYEHRSGLVARNQEEAIALTTGKWGHAWLQWFYTAVSGGMDLRQAMKEAEEGAEQAGSVAVTQLGDLLSWDTIRLDQKLDWARAVLQARAPVFYARQQSGEERTIAVEQFLELDLPARFQIPSIPGKQFFIRHTCGQRPDDEQHHCVNDVPCLRRYTIRIDRVFEDAKHGVLCEDYKFTGWRSPKAYAEEELMTDQNVRYLYVWNEVTSGRANTGMAKTLGSDQSAEGVRYSVFRLDKSLTASSFHEEVRTVGENDLSDSWMRLCLERAAMSTAWDLPRELWQANRYAHGPCVKFGRECKYAQLCKDPGNEDSWIGEHGSQAKFWRPVA